MAKGGYIVKIGADISAVEAAVSKAKGEVVSIGNDKVLIKIDYDHGDINDIRGAIQEIVNYDPTIRVQVQYDLESETLKQKLKEQEKDLQNIELLKGQKAGKGNIDDYITSICNEIYSGLDEGLSKIDLGERLKEALNIAQSYNKQTKRDLSENVEDMLYDLKEKLNLEDYTTDFNIFKDLPEKIERDKTIIRGLQLAIDDLKKQGAVDINGDEIIDFTGTEVAVKKLGDAVEEVSDKASKIKPGDGTQFKELEREVEYLLQQFNELDSIPMGKENVNQLIQKLEEARNIVRDIASLFSNNTDSISSMVKGWNTSDSDIVTKNGLSSLLERSAVVGADGKIYGSYAYGKEGRTNIRSATMDRMASMGISPKIVFHSHGNDAIATSSVVKKSKKENELGDLIDTYSGDIISFASDFKKGVTKQVTVGLKDIEIFDAEGFFKAHPDIDFTKDVDVLNKIAKARDDTWKHIEDYKTEYLKEFVDTYGSSSFGDGIIDYIKSSMSNIFNINDVDLNGVLKDIDGMLGEEMIGIEGIILDAIINNFKGINKEDFEDLILGSSFDISELYKKWGFDNFDSDYKNYAFRKHTPDIYKASGIGDYGKYVSYYNIDDFVSKNPLGLDKSSLDGMFSNTGIENFAAQLEKISSSLSIITDFIDIISGKEAGNMLADSGNVNIILDNLKEVIATAKEAYNQINGIGKNTQESPEVNDTLSAENKLAEVLDEKVQAEEKAANATQEAANADEKAANAAEESAQANQKSAESSEEKASASSKSAEASREEQQASESAARAAEEEAAAREKATKFAEEEAAAKQKATDSTHEEAKSKTASSQASSAEQASWSASTTDEDLNAEAEAFNKVGDAAFMASVKKDAFSDSNREASSAAQTTTQALKEEFDAFQKVGQAANEATKAKSDYGKKSEDYDEKISKSSKKQKEQTAEEKAAAEQKAREDKATADAEDLLRRIGLLKSRSNDYYKNLRFMSVNGLDETSPITQSVSNYESEVRSVANAVRDLSAQWKDQNAAVNEASRAMDRFLLDSSAAVSRDDIVKQANQQIDQIDRAVKVRQNQGSGFNDEYLAKLKEARAEAVRIAEEAGRLNLDDTFNTSAIQGWTKSLDNGRKTLKEINDQSNILATKGSLEKLLGKVNQDIGKGGLTGNLGEQYRNLQGDIMGAIQALDGAGDASERLSKVDMGKLTAQFQELHASAQELGQLQGGFTTKFAEAINNQSAQFLATYFSFQDMIRYGKQIAQTVVNTDSAITELRKVSGESNDRLADSFRKSADTAQELGSTVTSVINSTADWSRLGYDIDAAEDLSKITTLFQTVGDNMTQESASESLVSILQGYKMDVSDALKIVDSVNEVANNFAIDTAGRHKCPAVWKHAA